MKRVFIKGGKIVNSKESFVADILIEDEKISKVFKNGEVAKLDEDTKVVDASGKLIFPGFIDAHTHFELHVPQPSLTSVHSIRERLLTKAWTIGLRRLKTEYSVTMEYICQSVIGMKRLNASVRI